MNRKLTIISIVAISLMLAGIAWAVACLYGDEKKPARNAVSAEYPLLRAVPADAAAMLCFDGSSRARHLLADSTGLLRSFLAPENPALMEYLSRAGADGRLLVALHNSGELVPLVVSEPHGTDSASLASYAEAAQKAGLRTTVRDGLLLASRSETLLGASVRHLDEGICILEAPGLAELSARTRGAVVAFLSARQAPKLLQTWTSARVRRKSDLVRSQAQWTAFSLASADEKHIALTGSSACPELPSSFLTAFLGFRMPAPSFAEVLPNFTDYAFSIPVGDISGYLERYRAYQDANGKLNAYNRDVREKGGHDMTPEQWALHYQIKEAVRAAYQQDGSRQEVILLRTGRDLAEGGNAYAGYASRLLGGLFDVTDTVCVSLPGHWAVLGSDAAVRPFADRTFLDYPLGKRLTDAGLDLPAGITAYASVSDCPQVLSALFAQAPAAALSAYAAGAAYAPALAGIDLSSGTPEFRVSLDKRALKGTKVQVLERDTTVVIPAGPFPVLNSGTGKTNTFYQNSSLSLCLNDENGKGVWGVPFKQPICGAVEGIDYYANGKIQFLFAAGSALYLIDRLGRFVSGFPVDLGKSVLLGPAVYDFTGAHGYTVMVLHKDNSLEMYNLHGRKPDAWKGIRAPETVKALPELLEVNGHKYWVVRTSIRTLVYGFEGGEPLTRDEGGKMIRPDSQVTPTSRGGLTVDCYDGKTRDVKLSN